MRKTIWLAALLAACGDDPVPPPPELTTEEAAALFEERFGIVRPAALTEEPENDTVVAPCPGGGEVAIAIDVAIDSIPPDTFHVQVEYTVIPRECGVTALADDLHGDRRSQHSRRLGC